jgi:D-alanyl-D-alanine carboxypeptidase
MAQAESRKQTGRPLLQTMKISASERAHLQQVASARSTTVSDLIRQALRREGALPAQ